MPKKTKKKYSFPILKRREIIRCLKELGISISESDLKSPHEEKCKVIYAEILDKLMSVNVLDKKISFHKLKLFAHPSLHDSSVINVRLFRTLIKFMQEVGVSNFSISDLISPESSRTIRNLSAIINFARWREDKYQLYSSEKIKLTALQRQLKGTRSENMKLANEFVQLTKKKTEEKPQIDILKAELKQLEKQMGFAHNEMENKGDIAHKIKKEIKALKAVDSEKKSILGKNNDIIRGLNTKIVRSPERIKREIKQISNKIAKDKIEVSSKQHKLNADRNKLNHLKLLHQIIAKLIAQMQEIDALKNEKCHKLDQEIKKLQNAKNSMEKELKQTRKSHKLINVSLGTKKSEYSSLQSEHKQQKQQIQLKNKQINALKKEHSQQRISKQTQISNLDKQIEMKKSAIHNLLRENKYYINQLNLKYKQLLESVNNYHNVMNQAMQTWD